MGSLMRIAADEAQNFVTENVIGETWLSIMNRVRRRRGVESVRSGCISEFKTVGIAMEDGHRYEGRVRSEASVRRCPLFPGVMMSLGRLVSATVDSGRP